MNAHQPFLFPAEDTCVTHPLNPPPVRGTWSLRSEHTNHTSSLIYTATATLAKASPSRLVCEVANPEIPQKKRAVAFTSARYSNPKALHRK